MGGKWVKKKGKCMKKVNESKRTGGEKRSVNESVGEKEIDGMIN